MSPDNAKKIGKGADFGPALEKFEAAKNTDARLAAIVPVLKAKEAYLALLNQADGWATDAKGKDAVNAFRKALLGVWMSAERMAQPPKPL